MTKISKKPSRAKIGDVFEIKTKRGLAYFQYANKHVRLGEFVRVLPGVHKTVPDLEILSQEKERYCVFFPVNAALKRDIIRHMENFPVPAWEDKFPLMKQPGGVTRDGKVLNWLIVDMNNDKKILVDKISEEQRALSPAAIWNDTLLIDRIDENWHPSDES